MAWVQNKFYWGNSLAKNKPSIFYVGRLFPAFQDVLYPFRTKFMDHWASSIEVSLEMPIASYVGNSINEHGLYTVLVISIVVTIRRLLIPLMLESSQKIASLLCWSISANVIGNVHEQSVLWKCYKSLVSHTLCERLMIVLWSVLSSPFGLVELVPPHSSDTLYWCVFLLQGLMELSTIWTKLASATEDQETEFWFFPCVDIFENC